jgi:hypothetical protein
MKTQEIHRFTPLCSVALCIIRARRTLISKVVGCFSPNLLQGGRMIPKREESESGPKAPNELKGEKS